MNKGILLLFLGISFFANAVNQPNIIWLMAEDMSLDFECYGMPAVKTPNINKLANDGIRFDNCFVTNSICSPSRSAMMVGTHQLKTNSYNHRSNRNIPLNAKFSPFTALLRDGGYTCILGHYGVKHKGRKIDCNFKAQAIGPWDGVTQFGLFDKYDYFEAEDQPFFAQIQLVATHRGDWWNKVRAESTHPVNVDSVVIPPYMADHPTIKLDWAKYLDQVEFIDAEVGMIIDELESKGIADNTIIILIADNGRCNVWGKGYLHDPGMHIPLIIFDPRSPGARVEEKVVSATDITATIIDYAGLDIPPFMTGQAIFNDDFEREYVFGTRDLWDEIAEKSRAITSAEWKYIRNDKTEIPYDAGQAYLEFYRPAVHVMRHLDSLNELTPEQALFFNGDKPKEELYNLSSDPGEVNNLANTLKYREKLIEMRLHLQVREEKYSPIDTVFRPIHPNSVEVFQWVKEAKPDLYQQMLEGVEIGFSAMVEEYKKREK